MTPAGATVAQGGTALPSSSRPKAPLEPCWQQGPAGRAQSLLRGQRPETREGGEHGRSGACKRIGDPRGARAQPRELAQRARRGGREDALRRRRGQTSQNVTRVTSPARRSGDAERRADTGDAERATSRKRVVESTERHRLRRACAGGSVDARARVRVRRRTSSDIFVSSDITARLT